MKTRYLVWLLLPAVALSGCTTMKKILGVRDPGEPSVVIKSAETRWLLIKNPRFGDVPSEPEYVWVEEDKVPTTITTLLRGQSAIIAQPEIVAKYGSPPGGGKNDRHEQSWRLSAPRRAGARPRVHGADARTRGGAEAARARLRRVRGQRSHRHRPHQPRRPPARQRAEPAPRPHPDRASRHR